MKTQLILSIVFSILASSAFAAPSVQAIATNPPGMVHRELMANATMVHHRVLIASTTPVHHRVLVA